jgi:hypothetical protein
MAHASLRSVFPLAQRVQDGRSGVVVSDSDAIGAAAYVDNYATFGHDATKVDAAWRDFTTRYAKQDL